MRSDGRGIRLPGWLLLNVIARGSALAHTSINLHLGLFGESSSSKSLGARWAVVLLLGVYVFVPLTPAIMGIMGITEMMGPFTVGRMGIGGWMLLFGVLGYGVTRVPNEAQR